MTLPTTCTKYGIVHSRHAARPPHFGLHQRHPDADHAGRRRLPDPDLAGADLLHLRLPSESPLAGRRHLFEHLPTFITNGLHIPNFYFGGTSLLIVVGVAMDTANQIESQLIMRHYDGFSPRSGRIRGRKTW